VSPEQIRRRALAMGAEVIIDGKQINTGRSKIAVPRAPRTAAPEPEAPVLPSLPETAPVPAESPDPSAGLADLVREQASEVVALARLLRDERQQPTEGPRPRPLRFDVVRDPKTQLIVSILPIYPA
jgi:hypothetical protein